MQNNSIIVVSGTAGRHLAKQVCRLLSIPLGKTHVGRFADGEVRVKILDNVRDEDVYIINPTNPPAENIFEMALLTDAIRRSSAARITIVPVYLGGNRQDRKDEPRVPITAKVIIKFLEAQCPNRALLIDLHSEVTAGFFDIVFDHLFGSIVAVPYLRELLKKPFVVASPDKGGGPRAEKYAHHLNQADTVIFSKIRPAAGEVDGDRIRIIGNVKGKNVLFVDDMIDTGGTAVADARAAKKAGAKEIYFCATHALFSGKCIEKLDKSPIKEVIVTDTIHHDPEKLKTKRVKITVLSMAPLIAEAIRRIHEGKSLSDLILSKKNGPESLKIVKRKRRRASRRVAKRRSADRKKRTGRK